MLIIGRVGFAINAYCAQFCTISDTEAENVSEVTKNSKCGIGRETGKTGLQLFSEGCPASSGIESTSCC